MRARGALRVAAIAAIAAVLVATSCLSQERTREGDPVELASTAAAEVDLIVGEARDALTELKKSDDMTGNDADACKAFAQKELKKYDAYTTFARASADGELDCSAEVTRRKVNVEDRLYFTRVLETKDFSVGEYQVGRLTGVKNIVFADAVLDDDDEVEWVVLLGIDLEQVEQRLAEVALPQDASLTVLDGNGTILARFDSAGRYTGKKPAAFERLARDEPEDGEAGTLEDVDGETRTFGVATIDELPDDQPLYVLVGVAESA